MTHQIISTNESYTAYKWVGKKRIPYKIFETKCQHCGMYFHGRTSNQGIEYLVKIKYFPSCDEVRSGLFTLICQSWAE